MPIALGISVLESSIGAICFHDHCFIAKLDTLTTKTEQEKGTAIASKSTTQGYYKKC